MWIASSCVCFGYGTQALAVHGKAIYFTSLPRWTPRVLSHFISDVMCLCRLNLDTMTQKWVIEVRLNPQYPVSPSGAFSTASKGCLLQTWTLGMWLCRVVTGNHIKFHLSPPPLLSHVFTFFSLTLPSFTEVNHNGWTVSGAFVWNWFQTIQSGPLLNF